MALKERTKKSGTAKPEDRPHNSKTDHVEVIYIPVEKLIPDESNPNQMDERTFDALIEEIQEQGFDEPIHVRPHPTQKGNYEISSGHHRTKAAMVIGMTEIPAIVKDFSDREQKVALTKRNVLRGNIDKTKMVKLYEELAKGRDPVQVQRELGFTDTKSFEKMYDTALASLPPKAQKKLASAKETIKSVDDLSSVLNRIFKESGSELDEGYMVFSFGGKNHHYFQIGSDTDEKLKLILKHCEKEGVHYTDYVQSIVAEADLPTPANSARFKRHPPAKAAKTKPRPRPAKKKG